MRTIRVVILCALIGLTVGSGCDKVSRDRKVSAETLKARAAIDAYSAASQRANDAHVKVIAAFAAANRSRNLAEYRTAMRGQVVPRMNEFVGRLDAMQTGSDELKRIHQILVGAYRTALTDIGVFVQNLNSPKDLGRFKQIRTKLQSEVGRYRTKLDAYYGKHNRKLHGAKSQPAAPAPPQASTTTNG